LLAKTYKLINRKKTDVILELISLSNDALRFEGRSQRDRHVPYGKRGSSVFPAVKIGRLAMQGPLCFVQRGGIRNYRDCGHRLPDAIVHHIPEGLFTAKLSLNPGRSNFSSGAEFTVTDSLLPLSLTILNIWAMIPKPFHRSFSC
jgi:hypothetical protein